MPRFGRGMGISRRDVAFPAPAEGERSAKLNVVVSWECASNIWLSPGIDPRPAQMEGLFNYVDRRFGRSRSGQLEVSWFRGA